MFRINRILLRRSIVIVLILIAVVLAGCVGPRGWPGVASNGNDTLFVGTSDGRVLALDADGLSRFWEWEPDIERSFSPFDCVGAGSGGQFGAGMLYGPPVVADDTIYIASYEGRIHAVDMDGRDIWDEEGYEIGSPVVGGLAVSGNTLYIGASDGWLRAIDAVTGEAKEGFNPFQAGDKIWAAPVVEEGTVYFGSLDHNLYAINADTGELKWQFSTNGGIAASPLIDGGVVYIGSFDNKLYAVDKHTGEPDPGWTEPFEADSWFWAMPEYGDGIIYACSMDHMVYAINAADGQLVWGPFDTGDQIKSSPVIVGDLTVDDEPVDDVLVVAAGNGWIYGLDLKTGEERWNDYIDLESTVLAPLYVLGDKVYINAQNNRLYAIEGATGRQDRDVNLSD
jgi:outer membrane protein assembly factor BamB